MRIYEELFIVRPDALDEQVDPVIEQLKGIIVQSGGTLDKTEKWGTRKLAYRVLKQAEGQYILLQFTAPAEAVHEIERRLRVSDIVMKFITVRIDEKMKRIEKRKKARDIRAARKPAPSPSSSVSSSPSMPSEPSAPIPGAPAPGAPVAPPPARPEQARPEQVEG